MIHFFLVMRNFMIYSRSDFHIYNIVLLTVFTMLYLISCGLICFITGSFYLLSTFTHLAPCSLPHPCCAFGNSLFSVYLSFYCVCVFFLKIPHMISYIDLTWLLSLTVIPWNLIYVVVSGKISLFSIVL